MKPMELRLTPWRAADARRVRHAQHSWSSREGLLVEILTREGAIGRGEASPLPGYSSETLVKCAGALRAARPRDWWIPEEPSQLALAWLAMRQSFASAPRAALAACEAAMADLCAQRARLPLWRVLSMQPDVPQDVCPGPRRLAALLTARDPRSLEEEVGKRLDQGYSVFKLKSLGTQTLEEERERWRRVLGVSVERSPKLRLDANQTWPFSDLQRWLDAAAHFGIEFVEEPVPWDGPWPAAPSRVPTALDESLASIEGEIGEGATTARNVRVLVLKPTVLGLARSVELASWACAHRLDVVITHTFEGPWGFALCIHLALALGTPARAHGLMPHGLVAPGWPMAPFAWPAGAELRPVDAPGLGVEGV